MRRAGPAGAKPGDEAEVGILRAVEDAYAGGEERPLGSYALLMSVYTAIVAVMVLIARRRAPRGFERLDAPDLGLLAVATFRASRLVAKDSVTAVVRAPFTRFEEPAGEGEVNESVSGTGVRHAVGELLSCPFCLEVWIATVLAFGLVITPRFARLVVSVLTAVTAGDFLQFAYAAVRQGSHE